MPRRALAALAVAALLTVLSGCALPLPVPRGPVKVSVPDGPLVVPAIGDCLDGMSDVDSDWRSTVPCTEPHLYDIVAIAEWPGMEKALAAESANDVFRELKAFEPDTFVTAYWEWAHDFCGSAVREALGWGELDARFDALHVLPVGAWAFDMSLATRTDFVAGEHRTLCSLGWREPHASLPGATLAEDFVADTTAATEECWVTGSATSTAVDCAASHTDQGVLWFDARAAFGDGFLAPPAELTEADWDLAYAMCADLVGAVLPEAPDSLGVWAWVRYPELWDALATASPERDTWYTMDCLVGDFDGGRFSGDLFDGAVAGTEV
ncbi:MAG: septum formation family protein [Protaetiibacter sp.]